MVKLIKLSHANGPQSLVEAPHSVFVDVRDEDLGEHPTQNFLLAGVSKHILLLYHNPQ